MVKIEDLRIGDMCLYQTYLEKFKVGYVTKINRCSVVFEYMDKLDVENLNRVYKLTEDEIEFYNRTRLLGVINDKYTTAVKMYKDLANYIKQLKQLSDEHPDDVTINWENVQTKVTELENTLDDRLFDIKLANRLLRPKFTTHSGITELKEVKYDE